MKFEFTGYTKAGALDRFPALVTFREKPGFTYSQFLSGQCDDLRFSDSTQTNELSYEVQKWDTNGISLVWVKVPKLAGTNTAVYAYWGKAGLKAPSYAKNGTVWRPYYRGVWHLDEVVKDEYVMGLHRDSTSNSFDGAQGGNSTTNGVVGLAQDFDGNDKITLGAVMSMKAYTKEVWLKLAGNGNVFSGQSTHAFWVPGGTLQSGHNGDWGGVTDTVAFPVGVWQHIAVTYDSTVNGGQLTLYRNGVQVSAASGKVPAGEDAVMYFGAFAGANNFTGQIDEGRVSGVARSADWIWASWMNQASNDLFVTSTVGVPSIWNAEPTGVTDSSATLNGLLGSNRLAAAFASVFWGTNDAGLVGKAWQHVSALSGAQVAGPLSQVVSGLLPNQTYYYTYGISNVAGVSLARPAQMFKTGGAPLVACVGASVVDETSAVLKGALLAGRAAHVMFYWGVDSTNLTNTCSAGVVSEGVAVATLTGLNKNDSYYYTCLASNDYGVAWAPSNRSFSVALSRILQLEQNAEFGKAIILATSFISQGRDEAAIEEVRGIMTRLKQEKKAALDLGYAIESLEAHREVAERELDKEPEVGALLLRQVVREREGAILTNAAAILVSKNDPEVAALISERLKTSKDTAVNEALRANLEQLKEQSTPPVAAPASPELKAAPN